MSGLRSLLHPMLVHFPIALLFASVGLDWLGYWLRRPGFTRAGFYTLVLGAAGAGIAALAGPDHVDGAAAQTLLAWHQAFALLTVVLAVALVAIRFFALDGIAGHAALAYLGGTIALLAAVSLTGYYGGEMTYHQGVGVSAAPASGSSPEIFFAPLSTTPSIEAKPFVALIGLLCIVALALWLFAGRSIAPTYYRRWWSDARSAGVQAGPLWTLRRGANHNTDAWLPQDDQGYRQADGQGPSQGRGYGWQNGSEWRDGERDEQAQALAEHGPRH